MMKDYLRRLREAFTKGEPFVERAYDPTEIRRPVIQEIDCLTAATTHTIRSPFHFVERVIIDFRYEAAVESFVKFGVDTALTDGILITYDGKTLFDMKSTADLGKFTYDIRDLADDTAGKFHTVHSRYSFDRINKDGLRVNDTERLELVIQEDLSGSGNDSLTFTFEGWYQ